MFHRDPEACVDAILAQVGKKIVLGLPLGLGKASHIANALYRRAEADPTIQLHIFTALTLEKEVHGPKLLKRFAEPIVERLFGSYPDLCYARAARAGKLPPNIDVAEFYLLAGQWLQVPATQQHYTSVNYTEAPQLLLDRGVNVIAQLIAKRETADGPEFSLSSNTDITLDLLAAVKERHGTAGHIVLVGQVNDELPFMTGAAVLAAASFDHILDSPESQFSLFAPPKEAVSLAHHAIGLHVARLIMDGGTLQIGIGAIGDAVAWALILRHLRNDDFRKIIADLTGNQEAALDCDVFVDGLYGVSEMFADVFLDLYYAGILKRRIADGTLLHAAFFLGPRVFYQRLRDMPAEERDAFRMMPISFTNAIGGASEAEKRAARAHARFINSGMVATLLGEVSSDTREDGRVVSGVGGQYNFVAQAHALENARSIIAINATRWSGGKRMSNIRWACQHATIPRHLRDIIVTEYGVADLRGKSDRDCIAAMLNVAHADFQPGLLTQAKKANKIEASYNVPERYRQNTETFLEAKLKNGDDFPTYPFGTDLDPVEQLLADALARLKLRQGKLNIICDLLASLIYSLQPETTVALERIGLSTPSSLQDRILRRLLIREVTLTLRRAAIRR